MLHGKRPAASIVIVSLAVCFLACGVVHAQQPTAQARPVATGGPVRLVQPADLVYVGAFRLPDTPNEEIGWAWSGAAMACYPGGDPDGPDDGFPGSLFGTGHNWNQYVSEVSIPVPVVSAGKDVNELNTATALQEFHNIRGDLFGEFEIPRVGLAYLPAQGEQTTDKLHFCWSQHMEEGATKPSHGWCELDLSDPRPVGPWRIGEQWNFVTTGYMFTIPEDWAAENTPGMRLATGRFRDGGQGGQGPTLFAYGPWNDGNPPERGAILSATKLLHYSTVYTEENHVLNDYHHSDEWSGGAWLTAGGKSAVIFVGTKGRGDCWYGWRDGVRWPNEQNQEGEGGRGWWSDTFVGLMLFYDPADLAAVARGDMASHEPQPYATMEIDPLLYGIQGEQQWYHVGAASFDRERGILYMFEPRADGDKSIVHAWRVER